MFRWLTTAILATTLAAQDAANPFRFVPDDSSLVLRIAAPALWQQQFARTQVTKLMNGDALAPLIAQLTQAIDQGIEQVRTSGGFDADLLQGLLRDYTGSIVFAMQVDWDDLADALAEDRAPPMGLVIALQPAGDFDLPAVAASLSRMAEDAATAQEPLRDLVVGEHRLRVGGDDDLQMAVPFMVDDHLVFVLGTDLERSATAILGDKGRFESAHSAEPFFLHLRLDQAMQAFSEAVTQRFNVAVNDEDLELGQIVLDLGLGCLKTIDLTLAADEANTALGMDIGLTDHDRGLLGTFLFQHDTPRLLRYVPPGVEYFSVSPLDLGAVYRTLARIWDRLGDQAPMPRDVVEGMLADSLKVRLKEDLLDHLGKEMLSVVDPAAQVAALAGDADEDPTAMFAGTCYGLQLRDGKAFGASLETALRARGMHASRKTEEYQGEKIHRLRLLGMVPVEYAVTDDLFLVAVGDHEASGRNLRSILDARAQGGSAELPEPVRKRLQRLPAGWNGVQVTPMTAVLQGIQLGLTAAAQADPDVPPQMRMVAQVIGAVAQDLRRLNLDTMVGASWCGPNSYTARVLW